MTRGSGAPPAPSRIQAVPPPLESAVADWYEGADLADSYTVMVSGPGPHDLRRLADRALGQQTRLFYAAMVVRNAAVRPFGVETSGEQRAEICRTGSDHIDFFPVLSQSSREIVVGWDDLHLDFRLSIMLSKVSEDDERLSMTTVVRCHNLLGHVYLSAIRIGHALTIRSDLRRAAAIA